MSSQLRAAETTVSGARRRQTAPVPVKAVARWMPPAHSLASHATRQPTSSRARATVSGLRHFRRREPRHCRRKPRLLHLPACRREPHLCHHHLPVCRLDPHLHHQIHLTPRPLLFRPCHLNLPRRHLPCRNLVGRPLICRPLHLGSRRRRCRQRRWGATRLPAATGTPAYSTSCASSATRWTSNLPATSFAFAAASFTGGKRMLGRGIQYAAAVRRRPLLPEAERAACKHGGVPQAGASRR
jgi:hypothetical protein